MELYKIVRDGSVLRDFIKWLPDLEENETFYLSLFARKKYAPESGFIKSNDKTQLKRFTANKENMIEKIRQLEIPVGRYNLKEIAAPQESLVLYIMPNPRCMKKVTLEMGKKCWDLYRSDGFNLHQEAMSCIQRSKSYGFVVDFDIDSKDVDLTKLHTIFSDFNTYHKVLETKGGYHVLINPQEALHKNWFKQIQESFPVDQCSDQMIPVPGCTQGGFVPKFIEI